MSQPIVDRVWGSGLPDFLKAGVAGKLAYLADHDGEFTVRLTVDYLVKLRYTKEKRRLSKRTIQYQLAALQRCGFLEIVGGGRGRGDLRTYVLHPAALATVQPADPMLRPAHRRQTKLCKAFLKDATERLKGATEPGIAAARPPAASPTPPRPAHAPPNLAGSIGRSPRRRHWDPVRTPAENHGVFLVEAYKVFDTLQANGQGDLPENEIVDLLKTRIATHMPGQLLNSGQIKTALDQAAYRRRQIGEFVPAHAGSNGQAAFRMAART